LFFGPYDKTTGNLNMQLLESLMCTVEEAQNKLEKAQGHLGNLVTEKFACVPQKILKNIEIIRDLLQGLNYWTLNSDHLM